VGAEPLLLLLRRVLQGGVHHLLDLPLHLILASPSEELASQRDINVTRALTAVAEAARDTADSREDVAPLYRQQRSFRGVGHQNGAHPSPTRKQVPT
jgi:hypothetical protein